MSDSAGHGEGPEEDRRYISDEARELVEGLTALRDELAGLARQIRERQAAEARAAAAPSGLAAVGRSRWVLAGVVAVLGLVVTAGIAAGVLPAPLQDAVARVAETVNIDLPSSDPDEAPRDDGRRDRDAEPDRPSPVDTSRGDRGGADADPRDDDSKTRTRRTPTDDDRGDGSDDDDDDGGGGGGENGERDGKVGRNGGDRSDDIARPDRAGGDDDDESRRPARVGGRGGDGDDDDRRGDRDD